MIPPSRALRAAALALCTAAPLAHLPFIHFFGVNVPLWDQWAFVPTLQALEEGRLGALFGQHNEHRILFPRLLFAALAPLSGWNLVLEMYGCWLILIFALWGLWKVYRDACGGDLWGFLPLSILVFSLGQWQNILSGWQAATYLAVAGAIWSFLLLARGRRGLAVLAGVVASFSLANGLLVWPIGLVQLLWQRAPRRAVIAWSVVGALTLAAYFSKYDRPHQVPAYSSSLSAQTAWFFLAVVGSPLGAGQIDASVVAGLFLCVAAALLVWRLRNSGSRTVAPTVGLLAFSIVSAAVITVARASYGLDSAVYSKFTTITALGVAGVYLLALRTWLQSGQGARLLAGTLGALLVGVLAVDLWGLEEGRKMRDARRRLKYVLQTFESQPDEVLRGLYDATDALRGYARFLQERRLTSFRDPRELLLLTRWREAQPAAEILPERPLVQSLLCPVVTLHDLAVQMVTYGRRNPSTLKISVTLDGRSVGGGVVPAATIRDGGWLRVPLSGAVECSGRPLALRLESADARAGTGVTAWTYPPYFEGTLSQPGAGLERRVVGLQMNAVTFGGEPE